MCVSFGRLNLHTKKTIGVAFLRIMVEFPLELHLLAKFYIHFKLPHLVSPHRLCSLFSLPQSLSMCLLLNVCRSFPVSMHHRYEHGETFVLDDGGETDLDLGNYERFLDVRLHRDNNITTGKVLRSSL